MEDRGGSHIDTLLRTEVSYIRDEKLSGMRRTYYVLLPVEDNGKSTTYVPVDAPKSPIRKLLTEEQIREVIHISMNETTDWIDNNKIHQEFSYTLSIAAKDVPQYIRTCIKEDAKAPV